MLSKLRTLILSVMFLTACVQATEMPFTAERHVARGLSCEACHADKSGMLKDAGDFGVCSSCHGDYEAMIKRTDSKLTNKEQPNPHAQHDGSLACTECHKGHRSGTNYCGQCHNYGYKIP